MAEFVARDLCQWLAGREHKRLTSRPEGLGGKVLGGWRSGNRFALPTSPLPTIINKDCRATLRATGTKIGQTITWASFFHLSVSFFGFFSGVPVMAWPPSIFLDAVVRLCVGYHSYLGHFPLRQKRGGAYYLFPRSYRRQKSINLLTPAPPFGIEIIHCSKHRLNGITLVGQLDRMHCRAPE